MTVTVCPLTVFLLTVFLHTPHAPVIVGAYATWERCMEERAHYVSLAYAFPLCQILRVEQ